MVTDLDGVARCRFGVRCAWMDSRRRTTLFGVVVASMVERSDMVDASVSALKMDRWKMVAATRVPRTGVGPSPDMWLGRGIRL